MPGLPDPFLTLAPRLTLRLPKADFADGLYRVLDRNRVSFGEVFPWMSDLTDVGYAQRFLYDAERYNQGGQKFILFLFEKDELIGSVGFTRIDRSDRRGELGFWIDSDHAGRGTMTAACHLLLRHGFSLLRLNRIVLQAQTDNLPSRRIAEKLNFTHEGTLRQHFRLNGQFRDLETYALLREDYESPSDRYPTA